MASSSSFCWASFYIFSSLARNKAFSFLESYSILYLSLSSLRILLIAPMFIGLLMIFIMKLNLSLLGYSGYFLTRPILYIFCSSLVQFWAAIFLSNSSFRGKPSVIWSSWYLKAFRTSSICLYRQWFFKTLLMHG